MNSENFSGFIQKEKQKGKSNPLLRKMHCTWKVKSHNVCQSPNRFTCLYKLAYVTSYVIRSNGPAQRQTTNQTPIS